jgi:predicted P-loop ATPase
LIEQGFLQQVGESIDNACSILRTAIIAQSSFESSAAMVEASVRRLCLDNSFDPVLNYLDDLRHDGKPRFDTWLTTYLGAADNAFNRAIGRKVLIAAVRRVRQPGAKFDAILVLEGPQGSGKSSAIRILAGEHFSDAEILGTTGKEQQELVRGIWLFEISELAGLQKSAIEKVKAFVSRTHDRARPAWGRNVQDIPRRCVFIGTTNDDKYLQDPTGNRRFWPVLTGTIDLEALRRDRDQLWAEAAVAEAAEAELTIDRDLWAAASAQQSARLVDDPWEETLANIPNLVAASSGSIVIVDGELRVFTSYLLGSMLRIDPAHQKLFDSKRLGTCMRKLGWTGPDNFRIGSKVAKGYWKAVESGGKGME